MNSVRHILLRAKHWQIFLLLVGTYVFAVVATARLFPKLNPGIGNNPPALILLMAAAIAPYVLSLFGWLWAAGSLVNASLRPELQLRTGLFRFAIVYVVCGLVFGLPIDWASSRIQQRWLLLPQFFGFICILYILNFTAKVFVALNRGRRSRLWSYGGNMVELLALPLFVWRFQPWINRLYATPQKPVA